MRVTAQEFRDHVAGKPKNKYGAQQIVVDGVLFHSKGEARFWEVLRLREKAGEIYGLERQKVYQISIEGVKICKLIVDFAYYSRDDNQFHAADWKGVVTPMFRLKAKMVKAQHGVIVEIVGKS